jgi:hypothetical protein
MTGSPTPNVEGVEFHSPGSRIGPRVLVTNHRGDTPKASDSAVVECIAFGIDTGEWE